MDLLQLWGLARRNWLVLVVSLLLGIAAGAGISYMQPELYSATSRGWVVAGGSDNINSAVVGAEFAGDRAEVYLPLVQSRAVAAQVAEEVGINSLGSVAGSLEGSIVNSVIFQITARASSPELARDMADAAIRATSLEANRLETMTVSGNSTGQTVIRIVPVEQAVTPRTPISPDWTRNLALGAGVGLLLGFGLVVLRHSLDRRVRESSQVQAITGTSALGVVPISKDLAANTSLARDMGAAAEAMRQMRTNLRFVSVDQPPRSIVITSANAGEGKSTIAIHLASMLAASGQPTLLIDADLRRPRLAQHFDVDGTVGLTQVIAGAVDLADVLIPTTQDNLDLLPAGRIPPNPSEIVGSGRMQTLLQTLSKTYFVVIDAPPLLPVTDAGLLTLAADGAVLVIRTGRTRTEQIALCAENLDKVGGRMIGFVMNLVPRKDMGTVVYGYGYGGHTSQYYYEEDGSRKQRRAARQAHAASESRPAHFALSEEVAVTPATIQPSPRRSSLRTSDGPASSDPPVSDQARLATQRGRRRTVTPPHTPTAPGPQAP